jgi:hypothetical protein
MRTALELAEAAVASRRDGPPVEDLVRSSAANEFDHAGLLTLTSSLLAVIGDLADDALPGQVHNHLNAALQQLRRGERTLTSADSGWAPTRLVAGRHSRAAGQGAA